MKLRLFNMALRVGSLGAKMLLTLYMGRYLTLSGMGTYGLVTAYVAVAMAFLGLRLTYVTCRDIVDASPENIVCRVRDQSVFYGLNYIVAGLALAMLMMGPLQSMDRMVIAATFVLAVMESFSSAISDNLIALKKPTKANIIFFIRASLWPFPAIGLGLLYPSLRTVDMILMAWLAGNILSLALAALTWRDLPWRTALVTAIDWQWIQRGVKRCFPIWLGAVGLAASQYADRFVLESMLGRDYVGIASFYGSFTNAIQAILQSGIFAFSYPHLISLYQADNTQGFRHEARKMTIHASLSAAGMSVIIGVVVPYIGGHVLHRPELGEHSFALWLLLIGIWLRCATDGMYYVMYARHQDRAIWVGSLLTLIPAFGCNALLIPLCGFDSIGYSAIITAALSGCWRFYGASKPMARTQG